MSQADAVVGPGWRLVCHRCDHRYEPNAAMNPSSADCCDHPDLHVHDLGKPCGRCTEKPVGSEKDS